MHLGTPCTTNFTQVGNKCLHHSLHHSNEQMNYDKVKKKCQDMGSQMVEFQSEQEYSEVS